jgi:hypothetical protein
MKSKKYRYPIKAERIIETNDKEKAQELCDDGYCILAVRANSFIEDDDKYGSEFIYCLALPEDIEQED